MTNLHYRNILLSIVTDKGKDECYCHATQIVERFIARDSHTKKAISYSDVILGYILTGIEASSLPKLQAKYPKLLCDIATRDQIITHLSPIP